MERRHLNRDEMLRAMGMLEAGMRQIDVARALNTTQSVISRLSARYRESGDVAERHTGRHRITTPQQDHFLQLNARRRPTLTAPELSLILQETHNVTVSPDTVRNRLRGVNLRSRRPWRAQPLTRGNREVRYLWAQDHVQWSNEQWANVLFTDESRFGIHPDSRRLRVWREPGNLIRLDHVQEVHPYQGGTIMVWGGVQLGRKTDLVFLERFLTGITYRDLILEPVVLPYANDFGRNFILMHDNARPHTARVVSEFINAHQLNILPWPAQSPDLNPIEHVWDAVQRRILRMGMPRETRRDLVRAVNAAWQAVPQEEIDNLIRSDE